MTHMKENRKGEWILDVELTLTFAFLILYVVLLILVPDNTPKPCAKIGGALNIAGKC
jgi:hypothetical protein